LFAVAMSKMRRRVTTAIDEVRRFGCQQVPFAVKDDIADRPHPAE
jgi:hypothetical protein